METSIATTTKPDELSEFDRLILSGIEQAQSQAEPKGTSRGEKLAVLTLFVLGGILFFVGFFTVPWPLESFGFAFLIGFSALLWGSMFLISERLRWETLTADVVVLSWAYVPLAWFIPTVVIPSLELSEGGPWGSAI